MFRESSRFPNVNYWSHLLLLGFVVLISSVCSSCGSSGSGTDRFSGMKVADLRSSRYATFQLNDSGQVAWTQEDGEQSQIYMYGDSLVSIATSQGPVPILLFNDLGQIVWLTTDESDSKLHLYSGGEITEISNGFTAPLYPHINKQGQIVFVAKEDNGYQVLLYEDGQIFNLTDENGGYAAPQISDNGQVAWFGAEEEVLHVYLYTNGVIEKINENEKFTLTRVFTIGASTIWARSFGLPMSAMTYMTIS